MLKRVTVNKEGAAMPIGEAQYPAPFVSGLEFGAPARGTWTIAHTGMLVPEAHEIFVCADNCLRGVVLSAAEMGLEDRFSSVSIREHNVLNGDMEQLIIDGVSDILQKLPKMPRAVLVYTSCIHHFMGCDLPMVYRKLKEKFPQVDFTDCYMTPTMRKSGSTPEQLVRKGIFQLWKERPLDAKQVNIIGNNLPTDKTSDFIMMLEAGGYHVRELQDCKTYEQFQEMAASATNISYLPSNDQAGESLEATLGQKHLYLPICYDYEEIRAGLNRLVQHFSLPQPNFAQLEAEAEEALHSLKDVLGDMEIAIDYTAVLRPFGLAKLLCEHGFAVTKIYADTVSAEDKDAFAWLKEHHPQIELSATVHNKMRVLPREYEKEILCIGQKAAYFLESKHFVNMIEGGGYCGFRGIVRLCEAMKDAYETEKEPRDVIQFKGLGCACKI